MTYNPVMNFAGKVVIFFLILFFLVNIFSGPTEKFTTAYWLNAIDDANFDVDLASMFQEMLKINKDWGFFNFARDFINAFTGLFSMVIGVFQAIITCLNFVCELIWGWNIAEGFNSIYPLPMPAP